ncbi:MAG TPA: PqqD family protein [Candidatus Acidoferrum sp.]|nr:PqqD family protein [Candidatus Acidoferrum sp.]
MSTPIGPWQKNSALAWREIDDETVIISPTENVMHELNDTGSFLWKNIDGRRTSAELAELLAAEYEVTPSAALADTEALLQQLISSKLLVPAAAATDGVPR